MVKKIKALIPARSGSVRVSNKNIRPFAGTTLLEIKIRQLQEIPELDGVVVNSNSEEMLDIARSLGADAVRRDEYFASSSVSINEVYVDIANHFDADIMVYANCTNPLIKNETVSRCIQEFLRLDANGDGYDSLNTAHYVKEFLWLDGTAVNYNPNQMPRSQDLPNILALNFAVNILSKQSILSAKSIVGKKPFLYPIDLVEATDIDNEIDFSFAEFVFKSRQ